MEAAAGGVLQEKVFIEISQNSQESACVRVSFLIVSCKFSEISKNTFLTEHLWATASGTSLNFREFMKTDSYERLITTLF